MSHTNSKENNLCFLSCPAPSLEEAWIQTYSGKKFSPINPKIEDINIEDIAHSLSMQCRFNGHIEDFYSVAQHSVLVSYFCDKKDALSGLLHDASEAYICDIPSPLKKTQQFSQYREIERKLQALINVKFGLPEEDPESVKLADQLLLTLEAKSLLTHIREDWKLPNSNIPIKIIAMSPKESKLIFMERFHELTNK